MHAWQHEWPHDVETNKLAATLSKQTAQSKSTGGLEEAGGEERAGIEDTTEEGEETSSSEEEEEEEEMEIEVTRMTSKNRTSVAIAMNVQTAVFGRPHFPKKRF